MLVGTQATSPFPARGPEELILNCPQAHRQFIISLVGYIFSTCIGQRKGLQIEYLYSNMLCFPSSNQGQSNQNVLSCVVQLAFWKKKIMLEFLVSASMFKRTQF